jgi:hypothetical protein
MAGISDNCGDPAAMTPPIGCQCAIADAMQMNGHGGAFRVRRNEEISHGREDGQEALQSRAERNLCITRLRFRNKVRDLSRTGHYAEPVPQGPRFPVAADRIGIVPVCARQECAKSSP